MDYTKKAVFGIGWVSIVNIMTRGVRFLITLILARLLEPTDFGLVAIGLLVINTVSMFRDLGLGPALIYQKRDVERASNTAMILFPLVGVVLTAFTFVIAPITADFFNSSASRPVIQYLSLTLLLVTFGITPSILLDKEMEFKRQFLPELGSMIAYGGVAIGLAYGGYGVWALVYGKILSLAVWVGLIWLVAPWKPKWEFDFGIAKEMLGYGRHILAVSLIGFLISNLDNGVVGKLLGTAALGYYAMAFNISTLPASNVIGLVNRVLFPMYSKINEKKEALARVYLKSIRYTSALAVPMSLGILVLAPDIVQQLLGEKWMPAMLPLQILCIAGFLSSISANFGLIFNAVGKPQVTEKFSLAYLIVFAAMLYPFTLWYGIIGTSVAVTIPSLIFTVVGYKMASNLLDIRLRRYYDVLKIPVSGSFCMMAAIIAAQETLPITGIPRLAILVIIGAISYLGAIYIIGRELIVDFRELLKKVNESEKSSLA